MRRENEEWGRGIPLPSRLGDMGERRELPQRGPEWSPGEKRILCILSITEHIKKLGSRLEHRLQQELTFAISRGSTTQ